MHDDVILAIVVASALAFVIAGSAILVVYRLVGGLSPGPVNRWFRVGQIASGGNAGARPRDQ